MDFTTENFNQYLFYDIEVFKYDALVVFKDIEKNIVAEFWINRNKVDCIKGFPRRTLQGAVEGKTLVGYNNHNYDDYVLSEMLSFTPTNAGIKRVNDNIISGLEPGVDLKVQDTLDCFRQINVSHPSLKKIEANLGLNIEETSVPFTIDRELTEKEKEQTVFYCESDVDATIDIFKLRWGTYFVPKQSVVDLLPEGDGRREYAKRWNTTTLTAHVLLGDRYKADSRPFWTNYYLGEKQDEILEKVPDPDILKMWNEDNPAKGDAESKDKHISIKDLGCSIEFGFGGLHGVNARDREFRNVKLLDVASMYPNIIINLNALDELGKHTVTDRYKGLVDKRIAVKHTDQQLQQALKLVINSTYGLLKNQYALIRNYNAAKSVCMFGQIALYDLAEKLYHAGYTLINLNTDGVAFNGGDSESYKKIWHEWEQWWGLTLEEDDFDFWYQKDVNNYVARQRSKIKVKGGDVGKYHDSINLESGEMKGNSWFSTNTCGIISKCLVEKILNRQDPLKTIYQHIDEPVLFQYVLQAGSTYKGTFDEEGRQYQNVNRVFAVCDKGVRLHKEYEDGRRIDYPDTPKQQWVYNGDLSEIDKDTFSDRLDVDWYADLARKKCQQWGV